MAGRFTKKYLNRKSKRRNSSRKVNKTRKHRRGEKGGFLFDQSLNIGGIDLSRQTGKKVYNWKTGKWDNYNCYGIGPFKGCQIVPSK
jgi:hypothetical protein